MKMFVTMTVFLAGLVAAGTGNIHAAQGDCLGCHREKTRAAVRQWEASAHAKAGVGCVDCHDSDHGRIDSGEAPVTAARCGRCHAKALAEHQASRHGMGLHSGWGCTRNMKGGDRRQCSFCHEQGSSLPLSTVQCARFLKQTSEMGTIGCNRCHQVETSCAACHGAHSTDLRIVRDPNVCATCHMGPDHPQWEMWQTSRHGTTFASAGSHAAPGCQTCHMPAGNHNVSRGLTTTSGMAPYPAETAARARAEMISICTNCHAPGMARRELELGDAVRNQSLALVKQGEQIIAGLADEKLLDPMPDQRPPHPLSGMNLVLDSQMLYEDISHVERLFFKMRKYDLAKAVKGAYHQNPAYTHWYGNAELKMDLVDIRAEASRLRGRKEPAAVAKEERGQKALELLRRREERGEIGPQEAAQERQRMIDDLVGSGR